MLAEDEDAVICDFAETYHLFNLQALPLRLVATLAEGLPNDSRIKRKLAGAQVGIDTLINAIIADRVGLLLWANTEAGQKNRDRPKSIVELLNQVNSTSDVTGYNTIDDFEAAWIRINQKEG